MRLRQCHLTRCQAHDAPEYPKARHGRVLAPTGSSVGFPDLQPNLPDRATATDLAHKLLVLLVPSYNTSCFFLILTQSRFLVSQFSNPFAPCRVRVCIKPF